MWRSRAAVLRSRLIRRPETYRSKLVLMLVSLGVVTAMLGVDSAASQAEPAPNGVPGIWTNILNEEFTAGALNTSLWTAGWQHGGGISGPVSGRCFSSNQVAEAGGNLQLQLENQSATCGSAHVEQVGGLVESNPNDGVSGHAGFAYSYGYVEWRVYLPGLAKSGCPSGICIANWPALWSFPSDNTESPEIDTMEALPNFVTEGGKKVEVKGSACFHFHPPWPENGNCESGSYSGWHTFGSDWEPSGVTYYYDGKNVGELTSVGNRSQSQYLIMDQAAPYGSDPLLLNQAMLIDYVRVWRHPLPPEATTGAASTLQLEAATLNGTVNPHGVDTHYHFEYGTSLAYGSSTAESESSSGSAVTASDTVEGLLPGISYDFRLVATSSGGTSYGVNQTFTTPAEVAEARGPTGDLYVLAQGPNHTLYATTRYASTGEWHGPYEIASRGTTYAAPRATFDSAGNLYVTTQGPNHSLYVTTRYASTGEWHGPYEVAGAGTTYSTPANALGSDGNIYVTSEGPGNRLYVTTRYASTGEWHGPYEVAGAGTTYSTPANALGSDGNIYVTSEGPGNRLYVTTRYASTGEWHGPYEVAGAGTTYSTPANALGSDGNIYVTSEGPGNRLYVTTRYASTGEWHGPYEVAGAGTTYSTPANALGSDGNIYVTSEGPGNRLYVTTRYASTGEWHGPYEVAGAGTTYSTPANALGSDGNIYVTSEGPGNRLYVTTRYASTGEWHGPYEIAGAGTTY